MESQSSSDNAPDDEGGRSPVNRDAGRVPSVESGEGKKEEEQAAGSSPRPNALVSACPVLCVWLPLFVCCVALVLTEKPA